MKSKLALEALRTQLHTSLDTFSKFSSTEDIKVVFQLEESEGLNLIIEKKDVRAFGVLILQTTTIDGQVNERRLWTRVYPIIGSLNEVKYQAFKELFDIIIGNFIVNATRTDNKTLEALSNKRDEVV